MAKNIRITFRVSESDWKLLEQKIRVAYGIPEQFLVKRRLGDYMRQLVKKGYAVDIATLANNLSALRLELNKIGCNINQCTKNAWTYGYDTSIHNELLDEIDNAKRALSKIMRAAK
jgi:hypothetical protein